MIVDDGCKVKCDIVLGHADLSRHFDNLNLDIDLNKALRERVDVNETRVDGTCKLAELGDKTDITLRHRLVRVGADDTTRNSAAETDAGAERID